MKQRGFTIVELLIIISIMIILLTLAFVNLNATQANNRDTERTSEIGVIANNLETFYKNGVNTTTVHGRYPSTELFASGETSIKTFFPTIDLSSVTAPDAASAAASFIPATNAAQTTTGVLPQPTKSQYVYQPIQTDGTLCTAETQECRKYVLYYRTEIDSTVRKVNSKIQ
ncbi:MAG: putative Type secretion system protein [Candidatus Saccharibacteria bacterium]|nr:putative Type secretion system protein [Candidatus Saccharibacteria bacterium]